MSKQHFYFENYLNHIYNKKHRQAFSHSLRIETGRFSLGKDYIPPDKRICQVCDRNEMEDECHFLLSCNLYCDIRENLFQKLLSNCPNFKESIGSSNQMQVCYLLASECLMCQAIGEFCYLAFARRTDFFFETRPSLEPVLSLTSRYGRRLKPLMRLDL